LEAGSGRLALGGWGLASSTNKKVLVQRFDRETLPGFVNPQTYLGERGIELLTPEGSVIVIPYSEAKTICFVRDLDGTDPSAERRAFVTRPKTGGLWVRLRLRDGDAWEGLIPNNLLSLEARGVSIAPPDPNSNSQRLFVPRTALVAVEVRCARSRGNLRQTVSFRCLSKI
jgi:hypothetical protein